MAAAVEVAEVEVLLGVGQGRAEGAGQEAAGLERDLHQHGVGRGRVAVVAAEPGVGRHIVLGHQARAGDDLAAPAIQRDHPADQLEVAVGVARGAAAVVDRVLGAEAGGDRAGGELLDAGLVVARRLRGGGALQGGGRGHARALLDQLEGQIFEAHHRPPLQDHIDVGVGVGHRLQAEGRHLQPVGQGGGDRLYLAAAAHHLGHAGHRLEARVEGVGLQAQREHVDLEQLAAAVGHQRPGHHLVVLEVAGEEPALGGQILLADHQAQAPVAALRVDAGHPAEHEHLAGGQAQRGVAPALVVGLGRSSAAIRPAISRSRSASLSERRNVRSGGANVWRTARRRCSISSRELTTPRPPASSASLKKPAQPPSIFSTMRSPTKHS